MPYQDHKEASKGSVDCAVITVSDTRTEETDESGKIMKDLLAAAGHRVAHYEIVKDEPDQIRGLLARLADSGKCQAVLLNGGTGISRRDTTYEAVASLLEKRLDGFGEIFRQLSYGEIGSGAMLSRATAGAYRDMIVFSTPGSRNAVRLAMEKLIVPELSHLVWEIWRQR
jgi:molybdenum cofactor biosynthesis protein B